MAKQVFHPIPWLTGTPPNSGHYLVTFESLTNLLPRTVAAAHYDHVTGVWSMERTPIQSQTRVLAWWPMSQVAAYTGPVIPSAKAVEGGPTSA